MLDDIAKLIVWTKLVTTNPVALPHKEWEVLDLLVALEFKALHELFGDKVEFFVKFLVEAIPIWLFAFTKTNTMFDTNAD